MAERGFKYHGLGNDFLVLDRRGTGRDIDTAAAVRLCDRHRGVGADGVLVILPSAAALARMVVHNADGSDAEMCGNGLRCVVKHLLDADRSRPSTVAVETGAGVLHCRVHHGPRGVAEVEVAMGPARLVAPNLPSGTTGEPHVHHPVPGFQGLHGTAVSMGNPHLVLFDADPAQAATLGPRLEHAPGFAERTNVEFTRVREGGLDVVVWERGAGLTLACGTGACAAAAAAAVEGRLPAGEFVPVRLPGGELSIRVEPDLSQVTLRGPVEYVFEVVLPEAP